MSHNGVKHQLFLSILHVLELLASTAVLRWEREKQSCRRELVQIVSVPRSAFETESPGARTAEHQARRVTEAGLDSVTRDWHIGLGG